MKKMLILLVVFVSCIGFSEEKVKVNAENQGATWNTDSGQGATWDESTGPAFYLFPPYHGEGQFVETPAKVFGAIGVVPGTVVGSILAIPMMPWVDFEKTVHGSNTFFGQGFSMILGSPFYACKIIFWDVPKSWFD